MKQTKSEDVTYTVVAESCYWRITYVFTNQESAWFTKFYMGWSMTATISENADRFEAARAAHTRYYDLYERTAPSRLPGFISESKEAQHG